ncbi:hypothetical protein BC834DRAFT_873167 [Gloeopeniophorella convolvens]|nr:hypothetical protein BC834DRAFT_873167 [Gloeopeniophorella convolvens]
MDSLDSTAFPPSGSRLLSESPQFSLSSASSASRTGPRGDDLSLSDLSVAPRRTTRPTAPLKRKQAQGARQSIAQTLGFGAPADDSIDEQEQSALGALGEENEEMEAADAETEGEESDGDVTVHVDADAPRLAAQSREEKLQNDLFVLRQLNGAFAVYADALRETQAGTERVAAQLGHTDALLNKYIAILAKSEQVARLIFDERWQGAEADEALLEEEERAREEQRRREEEERLLAAQREQEQREREAQACAVREEAERTERGKKDRSVARSTSGVRGVRGTRASMRAAARGGLSRAGSASAAGGHARMDSGPSSRVARPSSSASASTARGTGIPRGVSKRP